MRHKFAVLRSQCDVAQSDHDGIERTYNFTWVIARDDATAAAKRERLSARGPLRGFVGTVSEAIDPVGQYRNAGVHSLINGDDMNDMESLEHSVSESMPPFARKRGSTTHS